MAELGVSAGLSNIQRLRGEGDAEELAVEFKLAYFLVGSKGDWTIYKTYNLEVMAFGSDLKIAEVDVDFHRYCQIQKKKAWLREQLKNIQEYHEEKNGRFGEDRLGAHILTIIPA